MFCCVLFCEHCSMVKSILKVNNEDESGKKRTRDFLFFFGSFYWRLDFFGQQHNDLNCFRLHSLRLDKKWVDYT